MSASATPSSTSSRPARSRRRGSGCRTIEPHRHGKPHAARVEIRLRSTERGRDRHRTSANAVRFDLDLLFVQRGVGSLIEVVAVDVHGRVSRRRGIVDVHAANDLRPARDVGRHADRTGTHHRERLRCSGRARVRRGNQLLKFGDECGRTRSCWSGSSGRVPSVRNA